MYVPSLEAVLDLVGRTKRCEWCENANVVVGPGSQRYCARCGHRADVYRYRCDCSTCTAEDVAYDVTRDLDRMPMLDYLFTIVWSVLAAEGKCDAPGGCEYRRILALYRAAECPCDRRTFIMSQLALKDFDCEEGGGI